MKAFLAIVCVAVFLILPVTAMGSPYNVAFNADVFLQGTFFTGGWGGGMIVDKQTITDGAFLPKDNQWDQGAVWWDSNDGAERYITIDLGGLFSIGSFIVQADDNDAYILSYRDQATNTWKKIWDVPNYDAYGWGMETRPNPADNGEQYFLAGDIITDALRFEGNMNDGDRLFAVSEIQAFGEPIPEPASMVLLGVGLVGLAGLKRKFKK